LPLQNCFQLGTSQPEWYVLLAYDNFEALPCQVISPYGAYARGLSENISSGVVLWQHAPETSVLAHAARKGFQGLKDTDLQPLLRELDLQSLGRLICIILFGSYGFVVFFYIFFCFFKAGYVCCHRSSRAEVVTTLVQAILPGLSPDELAEILLAAVTAPPVALRIDPEAAEGLLGPGPEAITVVEAAEPVPPAVHAQNQEFQAAAKKVKQWQSLGKSETARPKHWQGPPVSGAWQKEDLQLHLPSEHYQPSRGLQNTWEVIFRG
jgi:hypothetical protein